LYCNKPIPLPKGYSINNKKYLNRKYCSKECHDNSMRKEYHYNCANCNKDIIRTKEDIKHLVFCNDFCKGTYYGKQKRTIPKTKRIKIEIKNCLFCDQPYSPKSKNSKFCSQSCRAKMNLKINDEKLYAHSRNNIQCLNCGIEMVVTDGNLDTMNFCSIECMGNYYSEFELFSGEKSGTWNGGKIEYKGKNWLNQRRKARKRDNYTCQKCGIKEEDFGKELSVHHIVPFVKFADYKKANSLDNLICVCEDCHRKIHSGDNHPSKFKDKDIWMMI
jgi:5-methylcytosine-specific restriction endonuclease McrA